MTASLSDILSAAQNIASAINNAAQTYLTVNGTTVTTGLTPALAQVLKTSAGRVATVAVTTAGSAAGVAYDTTIVGDTTRPLFDIPDTVGIYVVNMPFTHGLYVAPGAGQVVAVTFS